MALRPIIILPDSRLRTMSEPVARVDAAIRTLMDDMMETMYEAPGIGLAAIQIAVPQRVVVIDVAKEGDAPEPLFIANPEILWSSPEIGTYEEGCLSIPDYYAEVKRPAKIGVRFLDRDNNVVEREVDGLLATCIQHEIDHLNGVLFIDHISRLKRERVTKKFAKAAKFAGDYEEVAPATKAQD